MRVCFAFTGHLNLRDSICLKEINHLINQSEISIRGQGLEALRMWFQALPNFNYNLPTNLKCPSIIGCWYFQNQPNSFSPSFIDICCSKKLEGCQLISFEESYKKVAHTVPNAKDLTSTSLLSLTQSQPLLALLLIQYFFIPQVSVIPV